MVMDDDDDGQQRDGQWDLISHEDPVEGNATMNGHGNHLYSDGSDSQEDVEDDNPPLLSSPSAASSLAAGHSSDAISPLRRELSRTTLHDEPAADNLSTSSGNRLALARRLSHLAQQLTGEDDADEQVDELALMAQVDQMEKALLARPGSKSPLRGTMKHRRPASFGGWRSQSDVGGSLVSLGAHGIVRSHHSELPVPFTAKDPKPESAERKESSNKSLTLRQANKIIAEADKLNEELNSIVSNLKARQEESDHIHDLLIERAERAAQRIIFLQTRISHLEDELAQNDDELQSLRICLKAVEIQMPPHPDPTIQRCIASFKEDYQRLRRKRASRGSLGADDDLTMSTPTGGVG